MKTSLLFLLSSLCFLPKTNAQDAQAVASKTDTTYWQKSFNGGLNFNQASFSNWSGGGVNSVAIGGVVAARALYEKGKKSWDNTADLQLGYVTQLGISRKSSDQMLLISVYGWRIAPKWDFFLSGTFNSYFAPGYRYDALPMNETRLKISNFFSPAQLTIAAGIAYRPNDWFSLRMSPLAPRFTFLGDQSVRVRQQADGTYVYDPTQTAYGVAPGKSSRTEWLAFQLQAALTKNITSNISLNARYQMYMSYADPSNINHRVDLVMAAKINKYLSTTFGLIALYNKDFNSNLQIQQTLGIGLSYAFSSFRTKKDTQKAGDPLPGRF